MPNVWAGGPFVRRPGPLLADEIIRLTVVAKLDVGRTRSDVWPVRHSPAEARLPVKGVVHNVRFRKGGHVQ